MPKDLLAGVRVADLGHWWSGPYCSSLLGALGADVIKFESIQRPDQFRLSPPVNLSDPNWFEQGAMWNATNTNKRGITLNLNSEAGNHIFLEIVKKIDIVIENFSPRVMRNLGLEYRGLKEINPRLIMVSLSCFGQTGPWRDFVGFGGSFEQFGGAAAFIGYEDGPPSWMGASADPMAGITAAFAIMVALEERKHSGVGQYIDISQVESLAVLFGESLINYQMTGKTRPRMGNHHPVFAPHNVYRCRGDDQWVAISVASDAEWAALALALEKLEWVNDPRFATVLARKRHEREIDRLIEGWTSDQDKRAVTELLQSHGVTAGAVLHPREWAEDPQFKARNMFKKLSREFIGEHAYPQFPIKFSDASCEQRRPAPTLGQHTEEILTELLGLSPEEIEKLRADQVIGIRPLAL